MASIKKKEQQRAMLARQSDTLFDGIANKFDENIYGTSKGQLRHRLLLHYLHSYITANENLSVLDAGGGTGMMSRAFCEQQHDVTLCDGSAEVLNIARERLSEFDNATILHTDIANLPSQQSFDLVICHAVLEWVKEPKVLISQLVDKVKEGGSLSLSFFNRDAALFNNAIWGNFEYIENGLNVRNQVRLNPHNAQKPAEILSYIASEFEHCDVIHKAGIRCFHDYMQDRSKQVEGFDQLLALEKKYGTTEPFLWLGKYFHILIKKRNK